MMSKSPSAILPIARSNSSSLMARSVSILSRSSAARVRPATIVASSPMSSLTSGLSMRKRLWPAYPAAATVATASSSRSSGWPRIRVTVTSASSADATKKKCHGRRPSPAAMADAGAAGAGCEGARLAARFSRRAGSVKVAELIVQTAFEGGIHRMRSDRWQTGRRPSPLRHAASTAPRPGRSRAGLWRRACTARPRPGG